VPEVAELTVDVTLQPRDIYQPFLVSRANLVRWVLALFACYLIYTTSPIWSSGSQPGTASGLLQSTFFSALVFIAMFSWQYLRVRFMFHKYPALRRTSHVSFSAEGMHIESEVARGDYKWSLFYQIVETPKTFLFMASARGAVYIPKRCLSGSDEIAVLRRLIRDNFAGKRSLRTD
jgi:hypothetical protein